MGQFTMVSDVFTQDEADPELRFEAT